MILSTQIEQVRDAMNRRDVDEANRLLDEIDKYFNGSGDK